MRPKPQALAAATPSIPACEVRARLHARHEELDDRLQRIERDRRRLTQPLPQDFADQAIVRENDEVLDRLAEATAADLVQVTRALQRLERGLHGQCERCGSTIDRERLQVRPEATLCRDCAEATANAG
jgi:DnaK suppressor protein